MTLSRNYLLFISVFIFSRAVCSLTGNCLGTEVSCRRCADDVRMTCGRCADDMRMTREWDFVGDLAGGWHMSSGMSSGMSSTCCPHIICRWMCHLHIVRRHVHHPHIICRHICHLHIICRTPHGQRGPELSFYCDRNWLLNGICRNNVELFHFRIM